MSETEFIDADIRTGWVQNWASPRGLRKKGSIKIREVVPGPFCSPRLLKSQPYVRLSPRLVRNKEKLRVQSREGIPDSWAECVASDRFCRLKDNRFLRKGMVQCCIRCHITNALWNELGIPFVQGIPDPSKYSYPQAKPVEHLRRYTCARKKGIRKAAISCKTQTDNGLAVGKKRGDQLSEEHVAGKGSKNGEETVLQKVDTSGALHETKDDSKDSKKVKTARQVSPDKTRTENDVLRSGKRTFKKLQKNLRTELNEPDLLNKAKDKVNLKSIGEETLTKLERDISVSVKRAPTKQRRKGKSNHTEDQTATVTETKKPAQKIWPTVGEYQREGLSHPVGETKGQFEEKPDGHLQPMNCNCVLPVPCCIIPAKDYFDYCINRFKPGGIAERVLCVNCEKTYRGIPKKSNENLKKASFDSSRSKNDSENKGAGARETLYARYKQKACLCLERARQKFQGQGGPMRRPDVKFYRSTESAARLKLVCCQCDCSHLKIASRDYNEPREAARRGGRSCTCEPRDKSRILRKADNIRKDRPSARSAPNSVNHCRERATNRSRVHNQSPERVSRWRDRKTSGNAQGGEINLPGENANDPNNFGDEVTMKEGLPASRSRDSILPAVEEKAGRTSHVVSSSGKEDRGIRGDIYREKTFADGYRGRTREKKVESNDVSDSERGSNRVKYLQRSRSDKRLEYVESDSGEHADISDTSEDVNINDTRRERSPTTLPSSVHRRSQEHVIEVARFGRKPEKSRSPEENQNLGENSLRPLKTHREERDFYCSDFILQEVESTGRTATHDNRDGRKSPERETSPDHSDDAWQTKESSQKFTSDPSEKSQDGSRKSVSKSAASRGEKVPDQRLTAHRANCVTESAANGERNTRVSHKSTDSVSQLFSRRLERRPSVDEVIYAANDFPRVSNDKLRSADDKRSTAPSTRADSNRGTVEYSQSGGNAGPLVPRAKDRAISSGNYYNRLTGNDNGNGAVEAASARSAHNDIGHNASIEESRAEGEPRTGDIKAGQLFTRISVPASDDSRLKDGNVNDEEARSQRFFNARVPKATGAFGIPLEPGPCVARRDSTRSQNAGRVFQETGVVSVGDRKSPPARSPSGLLSEEEYLEGFLKRGRGRDDSIVSASKSDNQLNVPGQWCKNEKQRLAGNKEPREDGAEGRLFTGNFRGFESPRLSSDPLKLYNTEYRRISETNGI